MWVPGGSSRGRGAQGEERDPWKAWLSGGESFRSNKGLEQLVLEIRKQAPEEHISGLLSKKPKRPGEVGAHSSTVATVPAGWMVSSSNSL